MKKLKKILLIHWHFFQHELVEVEGINFLTGKNATGKSTLVDALQLLLLGDANGRYFFNKAANERSSRSLKGYLRGETGDDGGTGFKYLREGRFSSYIACEFHDTQKKTDFTLGVVFDCYEDGSDEHRFFVLDAPLPDNHFIADGVPYPYKDLRSFFNRTFKKGRFEFPDSDHGFQEILKGKLGGLKNKYFSLFKKAVSFTPITDIEYFITEFVCDVRAPVDITLMQDNIRSYKRLEHDADLMSRRVDDLSGIADRFAAYLEEKQRYELQRYLVEMAKLKAALNDISGFEEELHGLEQKAVETETRLTEVKNALERESARKQALSDDRARSDITQKFNQLNQRIQDLNIQTEKLKTTLGRTLQRLKQYALGWRAVAERCLELDFPAGELRSPGEELKQAAARVAALSETLLDIDDRSLLQTGKEGLSRIRGEMASMQKTAAGLEISIARSGQDHERALSDHTTRLNELEKGFKSYDPKLLELTETLREELSKQAGRDVDVDILANLLEIREPRWRNVIEGYLHTQKFYLIVQPEFFLPALRIYDRLKFERKFFDWGLVDSAKLAQAEPVQLPGSLAEEVETDNEQARLFIRHVLGRVMKVDRLEDLRSHERAITDSGMLYQGFVARQLHPDRWKFPFIGRRALEEQIRSTREAIREAEEVLSVLARIAPAAKKAADLENFSEGDMENALLAAQEAEQIPRLEAERKSAADELGRLDLSWLRQLDEQIRQAESIIRELNEENNERVGQAAEIRINAGMIREEKLPGLKSQVQDMEESIRTRYDPSWLLSTGEPRFEKELQAGKSAREIAENFASSVIRSASQMEKKKDDLEKARSEYNREYKASYDIKEPDNASYQRELTELKDIRLPEYKARITDAREKAYQQFGDDFLAKLKSNMDMVRSQIDELNAALKECRWGDERYRFTWQPKPEYRRFYDMITDSMLLEGYNLASELFRSKHGDAIDELFRQITDVDSDLNADARAELEKNIKRFTDYRTYLNFDLLVTEGEDQIQRLSRTLQKKSGGETQTPFYISVLASFAQLYRIQDPGANRMRLILFDEAFSKMDSERIQESIRLLRRFDFQCILSAPPEKAGDIAPLVDRNLCVIREGHNSIVRAFDARQLQEEGPDA
ncbi:MAG TPA: hypothetical protein DD727_03770 [Clostridiales bacterium]|nr:hypothetical protein [Clostridiales bacterium]